MGQSVSDRCEFLDEMNIEFPMDCGVRDVIGVLVIFRRIMTWGIEYYLESHYFVDTYSSNP